MESFNFNNSLNPRGNFENLRGFIAKIQNATINYAVFTIYKFFTPEFING